MVNLIKTLLLFSFLLISVLALPTQNKLDYDDGLGENVEDYKAYEDTNLDYNNDDNYLPKTDQDKAIETNQTSDPKEEFDVEFEEDDDNYHDMIQQAWNITSDIYENHDDTQEPEKSDEDSYDDNSINTAPFDNATQYEEVGSQITPQTNNTDDVNNPLSYDNEATTSIEENANTLQPSDKTNEILTSIASVDQPLVTDDGDEIKDVNISIAQTLNSTATDSFTAENATEQITSSDVVVDATMAEQETQNKDADLILPTELSDKITETELGQNITYEELDEGEIANKTDSDDLENIAQTDEPVLDTGDYYENVVSLSNETQEEYKTSNYESLEDEYKEPANNTFTDYYGNKYKNTDGDQDQYVYEKDGNDEYVDGENVVGDDDTYDDTYEKTDQYKGGEEANDANYETEDDDDPNFKNYEHTLDEFKQDEGIDYNKPEETTVEDIPKYNYATNDNNYYDQPQESEPNAEEITKEISNVYDNNENNYGYNQPEESEQNVEVPQQEMPKYDYEKNENVYGYDQPEESEQNVEVPQEEMPKYDYENNENNYGYDQPQEPEQNVEVPKQEMNQYDNYESKEMELDYEEDHKIEPDIPERFLKLGEQRNEDFGGDINYDILKIDDEDFEEIESDYTHLLFIACGIFAVFLTMYCGGWVLCTRNILKTLDKTQRIMTGRSKFGDGYTLLPNANAKRA